jgi:hypothetical protein
MKKIFFILIASLSVFYSNAQNGGKTVFNFLNHSTSARMTGLGGNMMATKDNELALAWFNPASLNLSMDGQVVVSYDAMLQGIGAGYLGFAKQVNKLDLTFHSGVQYLNYGNFTATDEFGNTNGEFKAQDLALVIGAAKKLSENWSLGMNTKFIYSGLESYTATGISADVAAMYDNPEKRTTFSIIAKNAGAELSNYTNSTRGKLPFEVQMGFSKRLKHLPFRISFIGKDLQKWDVTYDDPNQKEEVNIIGEAVKETPILVKRLDNAARHLLVNGEFFLGKRQNLNLSFAYNYLHKKELSVPPYRSLTGFSLGFGYKTSKMKFNFGHNFVHTSGGFNHFTFATNINTFMKKK